MRPETILNDDVRHLVLDFATHSDDEITPLFALRRVCEAWRDAVTSWLRYSRPPFIPRSAMILRAALFPSGVVSLVGMGIVALYRAARVLSVQDGTGGRDVNFSQFVNLQLDAMAVEVFLLWIKNNPCPQLTGQLDLSILGQQDPPLSRIQCNQFYGVTMVELVLPTSIVEVEHRGFFAVKVRRLDLRHLNSVNRLPQRCFGRAELSELFLPRNITELNTQCFSAATVASLDMSESSLLTCIPGFCFEHATIGCLKLPTSVTDFDRGCFYDATIDEMDLTELENLGDHPEDSLYANAETRFGTLRLPEFFQQ